MVTRRRFLQSAGIAGSAGLVIAAGVTIPNLRVAGQAAPQQPQRPPPPPGTVTKSLDSPGPGMAAPGALTGTIVSVDGDLLYVSTREGDKVVRVTSASLIWKGGPVTASALQRGDTVQVSGAALPDGTIAAVFVEANIAQVRGVISQVSTEAWQVRDRAGATRRILLDNARLPEVEVDGMPSDAGRLSEVQQNTPVIVIGLALPDGSIRATKVFIDRATPRRSP